MRFAARVCGLGLVGAVVAIGGGRTWAQAPELIQNSDFERDHSVPPLYGFDGSCPNAVALNYHKWVKSGGPDYCRETAHPNSVIQAQEIGKDSSAYRAGLYQQASVVKGAVYKASAWIYATSNESGGYNVERGVGIDPYGGTDPDATTVIWDRKWDNQDGGEMNQFKPFQVTVRAESTTITVYTWIYNKWNYSTHSVHDDVSLKLQYRIAAISVQNDPGTEIQNVPLIRRTSRINSFSDVQTHFAKGAFYVKVVDETATSSDVEFDMTSKNAAGTQIDSLTSLNTELKTGTTYTSGACWMVDDTGLFDGGPFGIGRNESLLGVPSGTVELSYDDDGRLPVKAKSTLNVAHLSLAKNGSVLIEAANNYSENTPLRATKNGLSGGTSARFFELAGTTYYNGQNGATDLTQAATSTATLNGNSADLTIKSVSNYNVASGPAAASVEAALLDGGGSEICNSTALSVKQWVDEDADGAIDWLISQASDKLTCFRGAGAAVGEAAGTVTSLVQSNNPSLCGETSPGPGNYQIKIAPICIAPGGTENQHRLNANFELSRTVIHESRHAWQNYIISLGYQAGTDDDGNPNTPSNDDDGDFAPQVVPSGMEASDIIEFNIGGSGSDIIPDDPSLVTGKLETDATDFGNAHANVCP